MKKTVLLLISLILITFSYGQDITGTWSGELSVPNVIKLRIVFHISKTNDGYSTLLDSPDQGVKGIPAGLTLFENNTLSISMPAMSASYKGELKADGKLYGTFTQGIDIPLNLEKGESPEVKRPQEPKPPYPYKEEDVVFKNDKAGINLAGTLTVPSTGTKHPAIILVTGSGPQNRDEELMGHKPFLVIADYLTREGFAVLRYDDRGVGKSEGTQKDATSADFATDTEAALTYLKTRTEINPARIGIIGHSEGGMIAFMLAAKNKDIAFIISMAGPGFRIQDLMLKQAELVMKSNGMTESYWAIQEPVLRDRYAFITQDIPVSEIRNKLYNDVMETVPVNMHDNENVKSRVNAELDVMTSLWYISFMKYDPAGDLKNIKCPVFAINGEKDIQVHAELSLAAIERDIKNSGNKNVKTKQYPGLNHLFQRCTTCRVDEYGVLEETISPEVLKDISDWLKHLINEVL